MTTAELSQQRMQALLLANQSRIAGKEVCREIAAGTFTVAEALNDSRAGSLPMYRVLGSQKGWGAVKVERFCRMMRVSPGRRVKELTDREREILGEMVGRRVQTRGWH